MRTEQVTIYTFDELNDAAKDKAREWYRKNLDYPWLTESMNSVKYFCDEFGVSIKNYSIGAFSHSYIETDVENSNFRGLKLKNVKRNNMPTGYYLDCDLRETFYNEFKRTGNALYAFNEAIDAAVRSIVSDAEYQYTDESIDEMLTINEYEFTENGSIY
jgi:hypothetical protein